MSLWQFIAAIDGYNASRTPPEQGKPGQPRRSKPAPGKTKITNERMLEMATWPRKTSSN